MSSVISLSLSNLIQKSISKGFPGDSENDSIKATMTPLYILCWLFSSQFIIILYILRGCSFITLHNICCSRKTKEQKHKNKKQLTIRGQLILMNWQQGNAQSLNTGQGHSLKNTMTFVSGRLRNYLLCGAGKSPSNSKLMGLRRKSSSQIKLGSNVWRSYSNNDHPAWRKKNPCGQSLRRLEKGNRWLST